MIESNRAHNVFLFTVIHGLNCTFESGLCAWEQDSSDQFNWTRYRGNTPSEYTGPTSDHTSGDGYYIYIESSHPQKTGEKARLISSKIKPGSYCFVFWYLMYGRNIQTSALNVYKKSETVNNDTYIFQRKGSASFSEWRKGLASLRYSDEFQIVLEGVVGGAKSDIAVDDISLTSGTCSADCDFDADLCNWTQGNGDDFDWVIFKSSSSTLGTRPLDDHTGGGQYVYIETSFPRGSGDRAQLVSPGQGPGLYCLKFWYSMYGRHINRLNVYKKTDEGNETQLISLQNATTEFAWTEHVHSFQVEAEYQIVFEGVCGDGYEGDIAVDDISLIPGRCITGVTEVTDNTTNWIDINTSTRYTTTGIVTANRSPSSATLRMTGSTSKDTLMSKLTTIPIQTNLQKKSYTGSTRGTEKSASLFTLTTLSLSTNVNTDTNVTHHGVITGSTRRETSVLLTMLTSLSKSKDVSSTRTTNHVFTTGPVKRTEITAPLTTRTFFPPSKEITNSHLTSYTSNMYDTMTTDEKFLIISTKLPPQTSTLITLSTSSQMYFTDKPILNTVTDIKENSLVALYTALIAITTTLVVLVIALFIFMCRRRQGKDRGTTGCRDELPYEDERSVVVNTAINSNNMFKNKTGSKIQFNDSELCQEQYTEVTMECIHAVAREGEALDNEYSVTVFNTKRVHKGKQAYNHIQVQEKPFKDSTYSHICVNDSESFKKENSKYLQIVDEISDLDISVDSRVPKANYSIETFTQNDFDENQDIVYDHLSAARKANTFQTDDYSHLDNTNRGNSRDDNYGYANVRKKDGISVFEFFEQCDEEERNRNSLESERRSLSNVFD